MAIIPRGRFLAPEYPMPKFDPRKLRIALLLVTVAHELPAPAALAIIIIVGLVVIIPCFLVVMCPLVFVIRFVTRLFPDLVEVARALCPYLREAAIRWLRSKFRR
jgi:hypothetical protein